MSRTPTISSSSSSSYSTKRQAWSEEKSVCTSRRHWSTTFDGSMLSRVNSHVFKQISGRDGLRDFFHNNCRYFCNDGDDNQNEFGVKHFQLYKEYEAAIDESLRQFAEQERVDPEEIYARCRNAVDEDPKAERSMQLLLGVVSFDKFVKMMKQKATELEQKDRQRIANSSTSINMIRK